MTTETGPGSEVRNAQEEAPQQQLEAAAQGPTAAPGPAGRDTDPNEKLGAQLDSRTMEPVSGLGRGREGPGSSSSTGGAVPARCGPCCGSPVRRARPLGPRAPSPEQPLRRAPAGLCRCPPARTAPGRRDRPRELPAENGVGMALLAGARGGSGQCCPQLSCPGPGWAPRLLPVLAVRLLGELSCCAAAWAGRIWALKCPRVSARAWAVLAVWVGGTGLGWGLSLTSCPALLCGAFPLCPSATPVPGNPLCVPAPGHRHGGQGLQRDRWTL